MKFRQVITVVCTLAAFCVTQSGHSQTSAADLQISPTSVDFGENPVSVDGPSREITVNNLTKSTITLEQILTSGIDFSEKHNCEQTLSPGSQCAIQVSFTPAISGPRTGNLQVLGSDGAPHFVGLAGIGK